MPDCSRNLIVQTFNSPKVLMTGGSVRFDQQYQPRLMQSVSETVKRCQVSSKGLKDAWMQMIRASFLVEKFCCCESSYSFLGY